VMLQGAHCFLIVEKQMMFMAE
jgi:hypothetical protein